jgi:hypothetical protein
VRVSAPRCLFVAPSGQLNHRSNDCFRALSRHGEQLIELAGCAGGPRLTRLSLQIWEMQGDFTELQGNRRLYPEESLGISTRWIALSLT